MPLTNADDSARTTDYTRPPEPEAPGAGLAADVPSVDSFSKSPLSGVQAVDN
jgi:hypothetical protein